MHRRSFLFASTLPLLEAVLAEALAEGQKEGSLAKRYLDEFERRVDRIAKTSQPTLDKAAKAIVDAVTQQGRSLFYDRPKAFETEATTRAASLTMMQRLTEKAKETLTAKDVVVFGSELAGDSEDVALARRIKAAGAVLVTVSPPGELAGLADFALDNHSPESGGVLQVPGVKGKICPLSGLCNITLLWMLVAATLEEFTKRGLVPAVNDSIHLQGFRERYQKAIELYKTRGY